MPYALNFGVRIHYQVEGAGPPLILMHGFWGSVVDCYELGYVDALKPHFRLVLIDARGHGRSDKPLDPTQYRSEQDVGDACAVLDQLHIPTAHYWGYSMGGFIGLAMIQHAPGRLQRVALGGHSPYPRPDGATSMVKSIVEATKTGGNTLTTFVEQQGSFTMSPRLRSAYLANDPPALMARWGAPVPSSDDRIAAFQRFKNPCLLYAGTGDVMRYESAKRFAAEMPGTTFVEISGLNHLETWIKAEIVAPHVIGFLSAS